MTREKALECMGALTAIGYTVTVVAAVVPASHVNPQADNGVVYSVSTGDLGFDRVDLRALMEIADRLGLEVSVGRLASGVVAFHDEDKTPEVVRSPRRHPRRLPEAPLPRLDTE
jgi:hypothetical protein